MMDHMKTGALIGALMSDNDDQSAEIEGLEDELRALKAENRAFREEIVAAAKLVNEQAEDDGLWFIADSVVEAYLQQELRKVHAAVERAAALAQGGEEP